MIQDAAVISDELHGIISVLSLAVYLVARPRFREG